MYDSSRSENGSDSPSLAVESVSSSWPRRALEPGISSTDSGRRICRILAEKACLTSGSSLEPVASYASIPAARSNESVWLALPRTPEKLLSNEHQLERCWSVAFALLDR
uniref:Uncharacterized protein n=1 Tax=Anopheles farauti TaxID=69004 RepID=A0A182QYH3_9DIPT